MMRHLVLSALLLCAALSVAPGFVGAAKRLTAPRDVAVEGRQGKRPRPATSTIEIAI